MVRKDHLDLNNIMERYPKRPRRSGGASGAGGDGTTPPPSGSNDITPTLLNSVNGERGEKIPSFSSAAHHHHLYTTTTTTPQQQQQQQQNQQQGRTRWARVLRQPQSTLNEPYFGTNSKANFYIYTNTNAKINEKSLLTN